jgi:sugar lactone lactonase YvrE
MRDRRVETFAEGFAFLEAPRWRNNLLWVSDVFDTKVYTLDPAGSRALICEVPQRPAGLGFLPDGTLIIASMRDRKLLKLVSGGVETYADLSSHANGDVNDFVVDERGRIYVGDFGYDFYGGAPARPTNLHVVSPDGSIEVAAKGVEFPNAMIITNHGRTLVVAETWVRRLTAFDRDPESGALSGRRVFADLGGREPDGICVDQEGAIWTSCYNTGEVVRVLDGGAITDRVAFAGHAVACTLGGADGRTLYCTAYIGSADDLQSGKRLAGVFTVEVETPGVVA